jgi:hypothetical protein
MIHISNQQNIWALLPGTVIRVNCGFYDHVALLGDRSIDGERGVLSFSAKSCGLVEQRMSTFSADRFVAADGYLGGLPPEIVMQRARLKQGQGYSWTEFNCEHFVRYAHGVLIESPQLQQWAFLGGAVGFLALLSTRT